jgi:hypothetical protein
MKVFLSWSGTLSQRAADMFHKYLPLMLQGLDVFMSKHSVESGARWSLDLARQLDESSFGVLFLTKENLSSPWLLFEAGALTRHVEGRACGVLVGDLKPTDVSGPLSQFQHRAFSKEDLYALVRDVNARLQKPLDSSQLTLVFEQWWPSLDREYRVALEGVNGEVQAVPRDQLSILEEILEKIRIIERALLLPAPPATLREYLDQSFASLTERQKQALREVAKANIAGRSVRMDQFSAEDWNSIARWVVRRPDGDVYVLHRSLAEYLAGEGS